MSEEWTRHSGGQRREVVVSARVPRSCPGVGVTATVTEGGHSCLWSLELSGPSVGGRGVDKHEMLLLEVAPPGPLNTSCPSPRSSEQLRGQDELCPGWGQGSQVHSVLGGDRSGQPVSWGQDPEGRGWKQLWRGQCRDLGGDSKVSKTPDTCGRLGVVSRSARVSSKPGHHTGT